MAVNGSETTLRERIELAQEMRDRIDKLEKALRLSIEILETFLSRYDEKLTGGELAVIHETLNILFNGYLGREALK